MRDAATMTLYKTINCGLDLKAHPALNKGVR
jgi:hypothetical protein